MKKISLLFLSVALIVGASCKKKSNGEINTTPPTITLSGAASVTIAVGDAYIDAGATATDYQGVSIPVTTDLSNVDANTAGTYTATYSATDEDGNFAQKSRTVIVEITTQNWLGNWAVVHDFIVCTPSADILGNTAVITEFSGSLTFSHTGSGSAQPFSGAFSGNSINLTAGTSPVVINAGACKYDITASGSISDDGQTITLVYNRTSAQLGSFGGSSSATYTKQ